MNKQYFLTYMELAPELIVDQFPFVSYREGSEPCAGSPCRDTKGIQFDVMLDNIERTIEHNNGDITVVTTFGWVKFRNKNPRFSVS